MSDINILRFPVDLVDGASNTNIQYMEFGISTSTSGSVMGGDTISTATNTGKTFDSDLDKLLYGSSTPNKIYNVTGGLSSLNTHIFLPMPNDHTMNTEISYNSEYEPSSLQQAADFLLGAGSASSKAKEFGVKVLAEALGGGKNNPGVVNKLMNKMGLGITAAQGLATQREMINPRKEVMFQDFSFRSFSFSYNFAPRNASETGMVKSIIEKFRYYSLPEISTNKMFFTFPGLFTIHFMKGSAQNGFIPKIGQCVLKRVSVNYSPGGTGWATLPNGSPVQIRLTLDFQEIELVDRNKVSNSDVEQGGY